MVGLVSRKSFKDARGWTLIDKPPVTQVTRREGPRLHPMEEVESGKWRRESAKKLRSLSLELSRLSMRAKEERG